jgi:hypothetical protein
MIKSRLIGKGSFATVAGIAAFCLTAAPLSAEVYIYPKEGQSPQTQQLDESECRAWATNQTGYDPYYDGDAVDEAGKGKVAKNTAIGVAGGAAGGALLGAIGGRAGLGAAAGAGLGGLIGARKGSKSKEEAKEAALTKEQDYERALGACLEARGYSVS